ncbi:hypothetical protein PBV87_20575 [Niameybacter massiliensis]|uniref:Uncharacterized protein n=1 Tax=Holtiella tumoricola TaxID=3018743 RepID=A0AA42DRU0_9FIRM|nr:MULTISPECIES: hypothetical protein [Lachnospirales]MDA3733873.1 hypothetical protein [Holtiella tumoricola]
MRSVQQVTSRSDFATFLTDSRDSIAYNEQIFSKEKRGKLIKIKADDELVYEVHPEKKVLVVLKALYMTFHRDAYWDVAKMAELDEILADSHTLIRI